MLPIAVWRRLPVAVASGASAAVSVYGAARRPSRPAIAAVRVLIAMLATLAIVLLDYRMGAGTSGGALAPAAITGPTGARQLLPGGARWPDVSLPVMVDLAGLPPDWLAPARRALETWNGARARLWFVEVADGRPPLNLVRFEVVPQLFACGGHTLPAACTYHFAYRELPSFVSHVIIRLDESRIRTDLPRRPLDTIDLPALFTHELGHAAGLGEARMPSAAMFTAALWSALSEEDVGALQVLYGLAEGPRPSRSPPPEPPAARLVGPRDVHLQWEPVPDAFGYYVQVAEAAPTAALGGMLDPGMDAYAANASVSEPALALALDGSTGTEFVWRVKARTPGGNSVWSPVTHFALGSEAR